ncbi:EAL domain-containing protein [Egicoccus sp. AB-alg6-2]|uniref:EAL domain-containing protein n=1 Tax=Egicoccus sp. AB-alg6-2 TaxID=3242692 RepID=UPI00359E2B84
MSVTDHDWRLALAATVSDRRPPGMALQPIVDLRRGTVVGHEVLARFLGPPAATPDVWFAAAERLGMGSALTRAVLEQALRLLPELPADTFLALNLEPLHVTDPDVRAVLLDAGRLDRVVLELTEHAAIDDPTEVLRGLEPLRSAGARTAIDDVGSGYAGLQALLRLRPDLVKLDRSLVQDLDLDPARRVLLRALGEITDGIDAWLLGEGVETLGELDELVSIGVPLGQGYLLGRPAQEFTGEIPMSIVRAILDRIALQVETADMATLLERPTQRVGDVLVFDRDIALEIDGFRRPAALLLTGRGREPGLLLAKITESVRGVAQRAVTRVAGAWSDPVVMTDGRGTAIGIVRVSRMLEHLAGDTRQPAVEKTG